MILFDHTHDNIWALIWITKKQIYQPFLKKKNEYAHYNESHMISHKIIQSLSENTWHCLEEVKKGGQSKLECFYFILVFSFIFFFFFKMLVLFYFIYQLIQIIILQERNSTDQKKRINFPRLKFDVPFTQSNLVKYPSCFT